MKIILKILIKSLLYTSPIWILFIYLEVGLSKIENTYSYKMRNFENKGRDCVVLVLGNSEILKGVNPEYMHLPAYNMAHVSQDYVLDEQILKKLILQMPRLKYVLLGVSYISFGDDLQSGEEAWRLAFYRKHYRLDFDSPFDIKDVSNVFRYTPYESLKLFSQNFNSNLVNGLQPTGWMKTDDCESKDTTAEFSIAQASRHTQALKEENISKNIMALRNILSMLKKKGVRPILVRTPVMQNYYTHLNALWMNKNDSLLAVINSEFSLDILDFSKCNESTDPSLKNGFNDVNHLNLEGSRHLAKLICDEISGQ